MTHIKRSSSVAASIAVIKVEECTKEETEVGAVVQLHEEPLLLDENNLGMLKCKRSQGQQNFFFFFFFFFAQICTPS